LDLLTVEFEEYTPPPSKHTEEYKKVELVTESDGVQYLDQYVEIKGLLIPFGVDFYSIDDLPSNKELFRNHKDALFSMLLFRIKRGVPLSNYKKSKYYKYYLERLQKDHPEYLL